MCGVASRCGWWRRGECGGSGSSSNTSRAAPAMRPPSRAAPSATDHRSQALGHPLATLRVRPAALEQPPPARSKSSDPHCVGYLDNLSGAGVGPASLRRLRARCNDVGAVTRRADGRPASGLVDRDEASVVATPVELISFSFGGVKGSRSLTPWRHAGCLLWASLNPSRLDLSARPSCRHGGRRSRRPGAGGNRLSTRSLPQGPPGADRTPRLASVTT